MAHIIQLDRHVADLIAAGEVVERPASAVKELVENAIDAGATQITVEIQNGGMTFLRVADNGCGIAPEDAPTAFLRHATSKIRAKEDLAAIGTLGFRGEALAAISSVSRIDLLTKAEDSEGIGLHLEGGIVTAQQPAGCPQGTTIIVRDLFFNTPARMKFMKSDSAEGSAVVSVVQQQALAHPEIAFRLIRDGETQLQTGGDGRRMSAIYTVLGRELAKNMLEVHGTWEKFTVSGYVSKPTATRGNRSLQYFFLNGRFIRSRLLSAALEEAYRNQMMAGRFPVCVLEITMPREMVDVNVHPAKTEVKFLSERAVFDAVHYAVLSTLSNASGRQAMQLGKKEPKSEKMLETPNIPAKPQEPAGQGTTHAAAAAKASFYRTMQAEEYRRQAAQTPRMTERPAVQSELSVRQERTAGRTVVASQIQVPVRETRTESHQMAPAAAKNPAADVRQDCGSACGKDAATLAAEAEPAAEQIALEMPEQTFRVVGEVMDSYIIVEQGERVLFLDKHAAHERILFEKLKAEEHPIVSQQLLTPVSAELGREEAAAVLENAALLERFGFETADFGDGDVRIRRIPCDVDEKDARALLQELAAELLAGRTLNPGTLRDHMLHTIACKAAIKAGWHTEDAEREHLVREVLSREDIKYCPHGRPVCIELTKRQLERQFKRT